MDTLCSLAFFKGANSDNLLTLKYPKDVHHDDQCSPKLD